MRASIDSHSGELDGRRDQNAPATLENQTRIRQGHVIALFAFDVGYEVSLDQVKSLIPSSPIQPLSPKKRTPTFLQYTRPPQVLNLGDFANRFAGVGKIQATVFDFGVVSIAYKWPLATDSNEIALDELPEASQRIYSLNLGVDAREEVSRLMSRIESAIFRPKLSSLVEDYYLFVIENLVPSLTADELLKQHRSALAQTLRFETVPLSSEQQENAIRQKLSYYENDLLLVDWNAAIIYDQDNDDTANVLELLNVELLEARYIDIELDKHVAKCAQLTHKRTSWPIPLRTPFRQAILDLSEWRIESGLLADRVGNSLKLIGDLYLARVYSATAERFHLGQWQRIISNKLDIIDYFYQLLTDRVRTAQSQTLELAIIALILVELLLALVSFK